MNDDYHTIAAKTINCCHECGRGDPAPKYILIQGPPKLDDAREHGQKVWRPSNDWNLQTATHFVLNRDDMSVWCDHGSWRGTLVFDKFGTLTGVRVHETNQTHPVYRYHLTDKTVRELEEGSLP